MPDENVKIRWNSTEKSRINFVKHNQTNLIKYVPSESTDNKIIKRKTAKENFEIDKNNQIKQD